VIEIMATVETSEAADSSAAVGGRLDEHTHFRDMRTTPGEFKPGLADMFFYASVVSRDAVCAKFASGEWLKGVSAARRVVDKFRPRCTARVDFDESCVIGIAADIICEEDSDVVVEPALERILWVECFYDHSFRNLLAAASEQSASSIGRLVVALHKATRFEWSAVARDEPAVSVLTGRLLTPENKGVMLALYPFQRPRLGRRAPVTPWTIEERYLQWAQLLYIYLAWPRFAKAVCQLHLRQQAPFDPNDARALRDALCLFGTTSKLLSVFNVCRQAACDTIQQLSPSLTRSLGSVTCAPPETSVTGEHKRRRTA